MGIPHPLFFVSVAFKGLSQAVSLLFATLAGRSISVASKGLRGMVSSPDQVPDRVRARSFVPRLKWRLDGEWTVVSEEKNEGWGVGNKGSVKESGERSARMLSANHVEG